jgi:hypothetical protein
MLFLLNNSGLVAIAIGLDGFLDEIFILLLRLLEYAPDSAGVDVFIFPLGLLDLAPDPLCVFGS